MKIAVIYGSAGYFRVHAAGCRDVARDETKYHDTAWVFDAPSRRYANVQMWDDIASDTTAAGTPERAALIESFATETAWLPCCDDLPETTPEDQP